MSDGQVIVCKRPVACVCVDFRTLRRWFYVYKCPENKGSVAFAVFSDENTAQDDFRWCFGKHHLPLFSGHLYTKNHYAFALRKSTHTQGTGLLRTMTCPVGWLKGQVQEELLDGVEDEQVYGVEPVEKVLGGVAFLVVVEGQGDDAEDGSGFP